MEKALKALERIKNASTIYVGLASDIYTRYSFECNEIENALKDFKWLKSIISIDMYEQIPTAEDKIRFLKIMGVEL